MVSRERIFDLYKFHKIELNKNFSLHPLPTHPPPPQMTPNKAQLTGFSLIRNFVGLSMIINSL